MHPEWVRAYVYRGSRYESRYCIYGLVLLFWIRVGLFATLAPPKPEASECTVLWSDQGNGCSAGISVQVQRLSWL